MGNDGLQDISGSACCTNLPSHLPTNTYIYTFMGIFMRKISLLFMSSLTHSFSAKLKMAGMVLFETTYGSPGEGWGWHRFHKQLTGDIQLQGSCPWTIQTCSFRSAPEQQLLQSHHVLSSMQPECFCSGETVYWRKLPMSSSFLITAVLH